MRRQERSHRNAIQQNTCGSDDLAANGAEGAKNARRVVAGSPLPQRIRLPEGFRLSPCLQCLCGSFQAL